MNQQNLFGEEPTPIVRTQRQRDELFDVLALVCGIKPAELTKSGRGQLNRALKELRDAGASPAMVLRRAAAYRERFNHLPTPGALTRHWASLSTRPAEVKRVVPAPEPEAGYVSREELARRAKAWREANP